jgi:hypothetical protein
MSQSGYTPIITYNSGTTTNVPSASNLTNGELAINYADGKLFYKDSGGVVQVIGWKTTPATAGGTGQTTYTTGDILYSSGTNTLSKLGIGSTNQVLTVVGGVPAWSNASAGTVTTVSVVSANGFAGTVANASSTPAITLTTSITGILKGNGTAISAATSGTDYAPATSGTSILYGNGSGGFSNVTVGTGLSFTTGTLSATSSGGTSIGLVRAISINCIFP